MSMGDTDVEIKFYLLTNCHWHTSQIPENNPSKFASSQWLLLTYVNNNKLNITISQQVLTLIFS